MYVLLSYKTIPLPSQCHVQDGSGKRALGVSTHSFYVVAVKPNVQMNAKKLSFPKRVRWDLDLNQVPYIGVQLTVLCASKKKEMTVLQNLCHVVVLLENENSTYSKLLIKMSGAKCKHTLVQMSHLGLMIWK